MTSFSLGHATGDNNKENGFLKPHMQLWSRRCPKLWISMVVLWWSSLVPWASELLSRCQPGDMVQLDPLRRCDSMHLWRASGERQTCHGGCDGGSGLDMVLYPKSFRFLVCFCCRKMESQFQGFHLCHLPGGDACSNDRNQSMAGSQEFANVTCIHFSINFLVLPFAT